MDRNDREFMTIESSKVALRKESVDRNLALNVVDWLTGWSLSARRAWIEIRLSYEAQQFVLSLSARRAWIEIPKSREGRLIRPGRSPQGERG